MKKISKILLIGLLALMVSRQSFAFDWESIFEKLGKNNKFLWISKDGNVSLFPLNQEIPDDTRLNIPVNHSLLLDNECFKSYKSGNLSLKHWIKGNDEWKTAKLSEKVIQNDSEGNLELSFTKEGFYEISDGLDENAFYLIAVNNPWESLSKSLMEIKKAVEKNPDPQLYKSAILISKINSLLKDKPAGLTRKPAHKLSEITREYPGLNEGRCPDLTPGLYKFRLRRFPGAPVIQYVLRVPENYKSNVKSPFVYNPGWQGRNYSIFQNYVTLWCHSVTAKEYYVDDFKYIFAVICEKLNIDPDKLHIAGRCGDGMAAMGTALMYPDFWASCTVSLGNTKRELSVNACNMYMRFSHVRHHRGKPEKDGWRTFAARCLEYSSCSKNHCQIKDLGINEAAVNDQGIKNDIVRNESPGYIQYRTDSLKRGKAYWISIDGRKDEGLYADIKAKVVENKIYILGRNVEAYSIRLDKAPVKGSKITIIESDMLPDNSICEDMENSTFARFNCDLSTGTVESAGPDEISAVITDQKVFKRYPERYSRSNYRKTSKLSGGINDAFTQPYALVSPHMENKSNLYSQFSHRLASGAPCYADIESAMKASDSENIIFVGSFKDYLKLPEAIKKAMPYSLSEKKITADREYSGKLGVLATYPNPLNSRKYLVTLICNSEKTAARMSYIFMKMKEMPEFDLGVYTLTKKGTVKWLITEKFDATWDYHNYYSDILAKVKSFESWRWKAWRADVIREQIAADAGLFENCFQHVENIPEGVMTKRDIHRYFQNTWIVKIEIKGKDIKKILTVPFQDLDKRKVVPVISGISFAKTTKDNELYIGDIQEDKTYTLACPQKCLNGSRVGICPEDYKIIDDGFAVEYILDYLDSREADLDKELAELKLKIF